MAKRLRIVTDIEVPDAVPDATISRIAADTAMNFRWALQRESFYRQDWPRVVLNHRGVKLLPAPAPVTPEAPAFPPSPLGPGPGLDR